MSGVIPDDQFVSDQPAPHNAAPVSTPQVVDNQSVIPDDQFTPDEEKYGGVLGTAAATVAGAARGLTLGGSDVALTKSGLVSPQTLTALQQTNPVASTVGGIGGGALLIGGTGGIGGLAEGAGAAARIGAMAAEGGLFGAGNAVSEAALGDTNVTAQRLLSHVGIGAALGGGLGTLVEGASSAFPYASGQASKIATAFKSLRGETTEAPSLDLPEEVADAPKTGVQPTSFEDIQNKVNNAKYSGESVAMPQQDVLQDALSRVPLENPVHPIQFDSLDSQGKRDAFNTILETPGKTADTLNDYQSLQKNELVNKTENAIQDIAPGAELTSDATEGGKNAIKSFSDQYQAEKSSLAPVFEKLKQVPIENPTQAVGDAIEKMTDAVPGIAKMFDASEGELTTLPYKSAWGIDKATYNAAKEAVESLKENPSDFETLQNIRKGMDQHVDVLAQGQAPSQIRALKAALMDHMQDVAESALPDVSVRDAFKRYAINEQERGVIEKAFGASVGTPEFGAISKIKPEDIGDRIFANSANVAAAKNILPKEKFNEILGNWLSEAKAKVTDKGAFSSNKFGSFLKRNQDSLNAAFSDNPGGLQKLKDLTTIMRILPDAPRVNPSGTAKTLFGMLQNIHGVGDIAGMGAHFLKDQTVGRIQDQIAMANLNEQLAGRAARVSVMDNLSHIVKKSTDNIASQAKAVFNNNYARGAIESGTVSTLGGFDSKVKKIQDFASNPQKLLDHVASHTEVLNQVAPQLTQGLSTWISNGVSFLNSKIPRPSNGLPLAPKWEPTPSQKSTFNRYYDAVENPTNALKQIKQGILSNETMEALQAVHPDLLDEMKRNVIENMHPEKSKNLNYATKMSLSKFLQQPLDEGMIPQVIASNQAAFQSAQQSQQGGQRSSLGGLKQLSGSTRVATGTQREAKET